ncbi:platelet-derived growth factor receptor beta isoform X1 [Gadus morhua]|uniref:platelet-derived growth factor receptor beta isoform X1 n=2 Tax=Gadus morhua TaxID=8049 RepID=UPI0011B6E984|nr:platelet-derived growth factor receptor beta-like isoform X1 [Gadus morhua]
MEVNTLKAFFLVLLVQMCPEDAASLELNFSLPEVQLDPNSSFTVVCSGWGPVVWRFPTAEAVPDGVSTEEQGSTSTLRLHNASWSQAGRYACEEPSSRQTKSLDVFIPGHGPEEWFVPGGGGTVTKVGEEGTIPCAVSDPRLNVSLYERDGREPVGAVRYHAAQGFSGPLNDSPYRCVARGDGQEKTSRTYYVFSIIVPKVFEVQMEWSGPIHLVGDALMVNCTVDRPDVVYFTWQYPRRQVIEPLTEFLPNQIRSIVNISMATLDDSGVYVCLVEDGVQDQTTKRVNITVLERGFVRAEARGGPDVSRSLDGDLEMQVDVVAFPPPSITWRHGDHPIPTDTGLVSTTKTSSTRYVSRLLLVGIRREQSGSYTATVVNQDELREVTFNVEVTAPPRVHQLSESAALGRQTVLCVVEGDPAPSLQWYSCQSQQRCDGKTYLWQNLSTGYNGVEIQTNVSHPGDQNFTQVHSLLVLPSLHSVSAVRCEAKNQLGRRAWDLRLVTTSGIPLILLLVVAILVVLTLVFLIILIIVWRKKPPYKCMWRIMDPSGSEGKLYSYVDPALLPSTSAWEVPRDSVILGSPLGAGGFGQIVEASVTGWSDCSTRVAVKMLKPGRSAESSLMSEAKVLGVLGPHLNITNLLGVCGPPGSFFLITELCGHGDLLDYLHRHKHSLLTDEVPHLDKSEAVEGGYMDMMNGDAQCVAMETLGDPSHPELNPSPEDPLCGDADPGRHGDSSSLTLQDLISFSHQVAEAMTFLSSKNCVHRDLAARNVLVCGGGLVKVGDWRLSHDLHKDPSYVARGNCYLPVKWMSPESIFQSVYTTQSDVWSYGVLLWEIFSLGEAPYADRSSTNKLCSALKTGYRMARPKQASQDLYQLMIGCWKAEPTSRLSFTSLAVATGNVLDHAHKQLYSQLKQNFLSGENTAITRSRAARTDKQPGNLEDHPPEVLVDRTRTELPEAGSSHSYLVTVETSARVQAGPEHLQTPLAVIEAAPESHDDSMVEQTSDLMDAR